MTENTSNLKHLRFKQRFQNLKKSFQFLEESINTTSAPEKIKNAAVVKAFEMSFELSWKTLKDYFEYKGIILNAPRDIIKEAFQIGLIKNGQTWINLLDKRNQLVHIYDEEQSKNSVKVIKDEALNEFKMLIEKLELE